MTSCKSYGVQAARAYVESANSAYHASLIGRYRALDPRRRRLVEQAIAMQVVEAVALNPACSCAVAMDAAIRDLDPALPRIPFGDRGSRELARSVYVPETPVAPSIHDESSTSEVAP